MLVIPPRSQQLKLALTYQQWEIIQLALSKWTPFKDSARDAKETLDRDVNLILTQLRKEGHV